MAPAYFRNMSGLLLAFVVLSTLAHAISLLSSAEPVVQLSERRFGATIISTVLTPAKDQPAITPSHKLAPYPQTKESVTDAHYLTPLIKTTKQTTVSTISTTHKTEFKTQSETNLETIVKTSAEPPQQIELVTTTTASANDITALTTAPITTATLTTEQLTSQLEKQRNYLLGELQSRLNRYLSYPMIARRRGWQGEVMIAFDINVIGQLHNVRLAHSSGYSVLDHSAVTAINRLQQISLPDTLGRLQAMELQLPVRYQLHEG